MEAAQEAARNFLARGEELVAAPCAEVDLLIGMNNVELMLVKTRMVEGLAVYQSNFGTGWLLGGTTGGFRGLEKVAANDSHADVRGVKLDFLTAEAFGIDVPGKCKMCCQCKECKLRVTLILQQENAELEVIEQGLSLDVQKKKWTAEYPYKEDPASLQDNYSQALACMKSFEKRLVKADVVEEFNAQFQKTVDCGVFQKIFQRS